MNQYVFLTCIQGMDTRGGAGTGVQVIPAAPTVFTATADADSINLAWTRVGTYDKVLIDRKDVGDYTQIASINSAASYDDTTAVAGVTYTYRIRGLRNGYPSPYSATASATISAGPVAATGTITILDYTDPTIFGVTVTANNDGVTEGVDWTAVGSNNLTALSLKHAFDLVGSDQYTVTVNGPVVTITAAVPGSAGNDIQFSADPSTGLSRFPTDGSLSGGSD